MLKGLTLTTSTENGKTRKATLDWHGNGKGSYCHTGLPAGQYLVYVRVNYFYNWQLVELKDDTSKIQLEFTLNLKSSGEVEFAAPRSVKECDIQVELLAGKGNEPVPGVKVSDRKHLIPVQDGKCIMEGLRPGWLRIRYLGSLVGEFEVKEGQRVGTDLKTLKK